MMVYCYQGYVKNSPQIREYQRLFGGSENIITTEISFVARIIAVNQLNHSLRVLIQAEPFNYPSIEIDTGTINIQNFKNGDFIDVIGIYQGNNHITATELWLNELWKIDFVYVRSVLAVPFVLFLFFRTWKFDGTIWRFKRRNKHA
jgi:hypothetical protein